MQSLNKEVLLQHKFKNDISISSSIHRRNITRIDQIHFCGNLATDITYFRSYLTYFRVLVTERDMFRPHKKKLYIYTFDTITSPYPLITDLCENWHLTLFLSFSISL